MTDPLKCLVVDNNIRAKHMRSLLGPEWDVLSITESPGGGRYEHMVIALSEYGDRENEALQRPVIEPVPHPGT